MHLMGNSAVEGDEDGVGGLWDSDGCEGQGNFTTPGEDCGCSHSLPRWVSSWGLKLAVSIQVSFPSAGANHPPKCPNMVKSKEMAWIHPVQTDLTLFVTGILGNPAGLGILTLQCLFLRCGMWPWVQG